MYKLFAAIIFLSMASPMADARIYRRPVLGRVAAVVRARSAQRVLTARPVRAVLRSRPVARVLKSVWNRPARVAARREGILENANVGVRDQNYVGKSSKQIRQMDRRDAPPEISPNIPNVGTIVRGAS